MPSLRDHRQGSHHRCVESGDIHPSPLAQRDPAHGRAGAPRAAVPRAPGHYDTPGHDSCRAPAGHGPGWRRTPSRLRRFVGRQTVPKGPTAARAATLHHIHGQGRLGPPGENVGGHDRPPLGARRTPHGMVRTVVDLGAMVFVSDGRSRGRGRRLRRQGRNASSTRGGRCSSYQLRWAVTQGRE